MIDTIFESVRDTALLVVDMRMNIIKANAAFQERFRLEAAGREGAPLNDLQHPLWSDEAVQQRLVAMIRDRSEGAHQFEWKEKGQQRKTELRSKTLEALGGMDKRILLVIS